MGFYFRKKNLVDFHQENIIECNGCDYKIPYKEGDEDTISQYLDKKCPNCGTPLLTESEFIYYDKVMRTIKWINKYLGWMTYRLVKK